MKTLGNGCILGMLSCAFYLPLAASFQKVTIPAELKSVVAKVAVNTTSCSVTCGLGFKLEEMCEITPAGGRRNCTLRRSPCLTTWGCGLLHFTVPVGKPFTFSCLSSDTVDFVSRAYTCTWRLAPGLITMNDVLFGPFKNPGYVVRFSPTRESDAGTYRCDVRMLKTFRVIKRVYFGVRVIRNDLVDLNFEKSLTHEQKLAANEEEGIKGNNTHTEVQQHFWQRKSFYKSLIGIGSGVIGVLLLRAALRSLQKALRRSDAETQPEF
ncbi:transmembrane protein 81 [Cygnus atratus]|uniref:transmembrane protein 81 n=1 Tax=Cygnus atratus TaxID=8868 RepID=UPI0015D59997|nr:transmembrane protein 81 [Cygnus atratus]